MTFCPKFEFHIIAQKPEIKCHLKCDASIIKIDDHINQQKCIVFMFLLHNVIFGHGYFGHCFF